MTELAKEIVAVLKLKGPMQTEEMRRTIIFEYKIPLGRTEMRRKLNWMVSRNLITETKIGNGWLFTLVVEE